MTVKACVSSRSCERLGQLRPNLVQAGWSWGCTGSRSDWSEVQMVSSPLRWVQAVPANLHLHSAVTPALPGTQYVQLDLLPRSHGNCIPSRFRTFAQFIQGQKHSFAVLTGSMEWEDWKYGMSAWSDRRKGTGSWADQSFQSQQANLAARQRGGAERSSTAAGLGASSALRLQQFH